MTPCCLVLNEVNNDLPVQNLRRLARPRDGGGPRPDSPAAERLDEAFLRNRLDRFHLDNPRAGEEEEIQPRMAATAQRAPEGDGAPTAPPADGDAERAITEADIIQVKDGKLLRALRSTRGSSIDRASRRDRLSLLGRYRASLQIPFEMYLRDGVVMRCSRRGLNTSARRGHSASTPMSNPELHRGARRLQPGGRRADRLVRPAGRHLRLAHRRRRALYRHVRGRRLLKGCKESARNTTVTSLAVGDPAHIAVVDQLSYDDDPNDYGWQRSVSVTQDRMYIAGIEWDGTDEGHSTIQVVDISDPGGALVEGAERRGRRPDPEPLADGRARGRPPRRQPARRLEDRRAARRRDLRRRVLAELAPSATPSSPCPSPRRCAPSASTATAPARSRRSRPTRSSPST